MNNKFLVAIIIVLVAFVGILSARPISILPSDVQIIDKTSTFGATPGSDFNTDVRISGNLTKNIGAYISTSTTATTYTVVSKDMVKYGMIDLTLNVGAATFTLPATSTMFEIMGTSQIGTQREWLWHNATSGSGITLTLAKGAGMDLVAVTANDDVIDEGEYTRLNCTIIPYIAADNENVMCIVDELANAD